MSKRREPDEMVLVVNNGPGPVLAKIRDQGGRQHSCPCGSRDGCFIWYELTVLDDSGQPTDQRLRWVAECDMLNPTNEGIDQVIKMIKDQIREKEEQVRSLEFEISECSEYIEYVEAMKEIPLVKRATPPTPMFPCFKA